MKMWKAISVFSLLVNFALVFYVWQQTSYAETEKEQAAKLVESYEQRLRKAELKIQSLSEELKEEQSLIISKNKYFPAKRKAYNNVLFDSYEFRMNDGRRLVMSKKSSSEQAKGSLQEFISQYEKRGKDLLFATNAGIFKMDQNPLGLYIEGGKQLVPLNVSKGKGNFFLKPNGVFFATKNRLGILPTDQFAKQEVDVEFATQSGPMLLINGSVHPKFTKGSQNLRLRSGVGIKNDSTVVFAISKSPVNFYDFACFFKDILSCRSALYLDGVISRMYLPELNRRDTGGNFAAVITVEKE